MSILYLICACILFVCISTYYVYGMIVKYLWCNYLNIFVSNLPIITIMILDGTSNHEHTNYQKIIHNLNCQIIHRSRRIIL